MTHLHITDRFREYSGPLEHTTCTVTHEPCLIYDVYEAADGTEVLVGANVSRKLQNALNRTPDPSAVVKCGEHEVTVHRDYEQPFIPQPQDV